MDVPSLQPEDGRTTETGSGLGVRGDLELGCPMRIMGGDKVDEACHEKDREAVFSGDASEGSASREGGESQSAASGESARGDGDEKPGGGGAETAGVRPDQHEARSSRRVGIVCAPRNYKRPQSLQDLQSSGGGGGPACYSTTPGNTSTTRTCPPAIPPRSPLRPCLHNQPSPPAFVGTSPLVTTPPSSDTHDDDSQLILMPSLRESFGGSLTALLATLEAETLHDKALPLPPDQEDELTVDYSDEIEEDDYDPDTSQQSSTDSFTLEIPTSPAPAGSTTPNQPTVMTKRVHALRELLSSERAYTSDLALIRDIHIPLALGRSHPFIMLYADPLTWVCVAGQPTPFSTNGTPSPPPFSPSSGSSSSSRTVSTASDSSTASSQLGPPMTRDDVRIIFSNIGDLAMFSDHFVDRLEEALGGALDGGSGEDRVGALFLEIVSTHAPHHPASHLPSDPCPRATL